MRIHRAFLTATTLWLASMTLANAQPTMMHRPASPALAPTPLVQGPQHRYFGTLETATGNALVMRTRNGTDLRVDATQAFALKRVAEPLFRGKPTVVVGTFGTDKVFHATAVQRAAPRPSTWGTDI